MTPFLRRLIVALCTAAAFIGVSGRPEVGAGAALAVLALWWVLAGGVHDRMERIEGRAARRGDRR